ncbi:PAS domain S-box-containing protein [Candidatus Kryptonium thompsonii]|uniref:histidine kinase n=1 Tax=Candidatus Kryptonium thompsonii TaxID=1633631 RepID=A0A0P1LGF3_9BACT|nr:ATP-binding protein [Candidatus Kryptonium thompsoni]CUS80567.1 PAS domain S-box-containing protein [Candidatus Kryptonium thompsoni]CUS82569.1 PAS domain S-box-containing protein [Candidatus Kryptonium thompsoni]CUS85500.1 PAS domain S-box-containing protein [Candidatus Kryptonium thompsoni]CUS88336.1 PAS domain S-box-containing protein [Candidatus Kryptonium thompsoni]CUS92985.1 PAS domain S-box-containing protein [Candidatus Kryptonium thompsoni]
MEHRILSKIDEFLAEIDKSLREELSTNFTSIKQEDIQKIHQILIKYIHQVIDLAKKGRSVHERVLHSIIQNYSDAVIALDNDYKIFFWNKGAERIFGYTLDEMLGKTVDPIVPSELKEKGELQWLFEETLRKGYIENYETERITKDGRRIIVNLSRSLIKDENGEILGSIAIVKDVTKVKELEKQIQHSDKLALIGQIAAGIAHEIGTPLNVISGNAEYIMMEMGENNPYKEELETIISQAERIANLIKQLLEFARPKKPNYTKINVNHEISHVVELLKHQFEKSNIKLNLKFSENIPDIYADCSQIHQVFLNIIMNAIQAINQNGLIEIETFLRDGYVNIKFKDNGIGILPEHIDKIFEPFFTTKEAGKGTGLGLAVSKRIIDEHNGKVEVESTPGKGTIFTVKFPAYITKEDREI